MMFLVPEPEASGTIECFAGPHHAQRKRAAAMPQPFSWKVCRCCADPVIRNGAPPRKSLGSTYRHLSRDRQDQKQRWAPNVPVFPDLPRPWRSSDWPQRRLLAAFSQITHRSWNEGHGDPLCRRIGSAVVHTLPGRAARPFPRLNRLHPGAAGSVSGGVSSCRFRPRSGSGRSGSWRRASA